MNDDNIPVRRIFSVIFASALLCGVSMIIFGDIAAKIVLGFLIVCGAVLIPAALFVLIVSPWLPERIRQRWGL